MADSEHRLNGIARAALPLQRERTVFAVTGAIATLLALLVEGVLVGLAGVEASQSSDPNGGAKALYILTCLVAVALASWAAAVTRSRPRRASLLGAAAIVLGAVAAVVIAHLADGFSRPEARVIVLGIWLFLTSPVDVAVVMGLLPQSSDPDPKWGRVIALAYVGLSTVLLVTVMFASVNDLTAWGALIVWLLLTSAITTLGLRGTKTSEARHAIR